MLPRADCRRKTLEDTQLEAFLYVPFAPGGHMNAMAAVFGCQPVADQPFQRCPYRRTAEAKFARQMFFLYRVPGR